MSDPKPTTPECIAETIRDFMRSEYGTPGFTAGNLTQAVWDALLNEGEVREQGTYAYTWERSLVVPLLGATRTKDTT